ncbi:HpcH/HpaI aldolase/citrate lyase family protein [Roseicella frigidaeris]|uniref:CoA ester lyase n=1 Tax=Roseicella frigidaeris TaxID=2230885 RepID=A0A327M9V1_9PROT|nr:CoA ester lyase [Roseicella frigidaeris]RAI58903.1 CoA ester lyase [Roseicella frigidaeris]
MILATRPQRSELSVPASSGRFFAKAAASAADAVVIDLEDGVAAERKDAARAEAIAAINGLDWGGRILSVRVNGIGTPWCHRDIVEVASACPRLDRIVLPKAEDAFDIRFLAALLDGIEAARGPGRRIGIAALVETPRGIGHAEAIAAAHPRLETMIFGLGDYMAAMRTPDATVGRPNPDYAMPGAAPGAPPVVLDQWHYALARLANACRAEGLLPIDAVYADYRDLAGLRAAALRGRALGYAGKWAIHPDQVAVINEVHGPDAARVEWARRALALLAQAEASGAGAAGEGGVMLDAVHARMAREILQQAGETA